MNEEVQFQRPELMPLSILRAVWKRKLLIALAFFSLAAVSIIVVMLLPAVYTARALILIEEQRIPERFVTATVNEGLDSRLNRISQQILAYDNLLRLIEEFELYPEDRDRLSEEELVRGMADNIRVSRVDGMTVNRGNTTAFQISFEADNANHVAQVANRLAGNFVQENLRTRTNAALGTSEFLNAQIREAKSRLDEAELALRDYRLRFMGELPEQEGAVGAQIARSQVAYQAAESEVTRAHQSKMFLKNSLDAALTTLEIVNRVAADERASIDVLGGGSGSPRAARDRLATAMARYDMLKSRYSDNHPDVIQAKAYLEELQTSPPALDESLPNDAPEAIQANETNELSFQTAQAVLQAETRIVQLKTQIIVADQNIVSAEARRLRASTALGVFASKMGRIPLHQQELTGVQRDYETALMQWKELNGKSFDADLATTMEQRERSERFSILEPARVPSKPVWPPRAAIAGGASLASLVLACALGFLLELKKNVVLGEWEMPPEVAVLGRIPVIDQDDRDPQASPGRAGFSFQKRVVVASSVILSMVAMVVATSLYFGWISF